MARTPSDSQLRIVNNFGSVNVQGDDGVRKLSQTWSSEEGVSTINVSANNIGVSGAAVLGSALKKSMSITSVDCSRNSLRDEGAELLVPALLSDGTSVSTLRVLSLIRCGIGDDGENKTNSITTKNHWPTCERPQAEAKWAYLFVSKVVLISFRYKKWLFPPLPRTRTYDMT